MLKMKVNYDKQSKCENCERPWLKTKEMYDIKFMNNCYTVCKECLEDVFHKLLKADCMYLGKVKNQEDLDRKQRSMKYNGKKKF